MVAFLLDESGQGIVEYALIIGLVASGAVGALHVMGDRIGSLNNAFGWALGENVHVEESRRRIEDIAEAFK